MPHWRTINRGGSYNRLAEPSWVNPLDTTYSQAKGGRWNPPSSFGVLYLNRDVPLARLQVRHKLLGHPYGVEDLDEPEQHDLVEVDVDTRDWLDCMTPAGLDAVGLPETYPRHRNGQPVRHSSCQPIGQAAFDDDLPGLACRSAATGASSTDEELGVFDREVTTAVRMVRRLTFTDWYWGSSR